MVKGVKRVYKSKSITEDSERSPESKKYTKIMEELAAARAAAQKQRSPYYYHRSKFGPQSMLRSKPV